MNDHHVHQQLGALQAEVSNLKEQVGSIDDKVDTLLERSAAARGGRGMLWKVGTLSSAVTTLLLAVAQWWSGLRGN